MDLNGFGSGMFFKLGPEGTNMHDSPLEDKRWKKSNEASIFAKWNSQKLWKKPQAARIAVIDTPPPYPSGKIHIGSAIHYSQIDMIARSWRMMGKNIFIKGVRNGYKLSRCCR